MGVVGRWVCGLMVECVRGSGCLTCFVLLFSGLMVALHRSLSTSTAVRHLLYCCNTWRVGRSLLGGRCCSTFCCIAVSGWVDRFVAVVCSCRVPTVSWVFLLFFVAGEGKIIVLFQNFRFFSFDLCVGTAPRNMGTAPRFWRALPLFGDNTFPKYVY